MAAQETSPAEMSVVHQLGTVSSTWDVDFSRLGALQREDLALERSSQEGGIKIWREEEEQHQIPTSYKLLS